MLETSFVGDWRIVVTQHDASWSQRVIVKNTAAGQQVLAGTVGLHLNVQGNGTSPWQLTIEHNDGSGWTSNDLRVDPRQISGASITQMVRSDDSPTTGDRDYNDLVVRVEKLGMVDQPSAPFAVWPATMQVMPEGIFETALGQYFLAVTIRNIWTEPWPAQAAVGLTTRCRSWLEAGGVVVDDMWTANDQAAVGQEVVGGRVLVGPLATWKTRVTYFKVAVSGAQVRKHNVEIEVLQPSAEDLDHLNRKARATMLVTRTTYDAATNTFVASCDRGSLRAAVKELTVDYHTFKRAVARARELFASGGGTPPGGTGTGLSS